MDQKSPSPSRLPVLPAMGNPNCRRLPTDWTKNRHSGRVINTVILFVVFPGALPTGPVYNFIAVFSMMLGIYMPYDWLHAAARQSNLGSYLETTY